MYLQGGTNTCISSSLRKEAADKVKTTVPLATVILSFPALTCGLPEAEHLHEGGYPSPWPDGGLDGGVQLFRLNHPVIECIEA